MPEVLNPVPARPTQEELIEEILQQREEKAKEVIKKIEHLESLKATLNQYEKLRLLLIDSEGNLIETSPYASLFRKNPDMQFAVKDADSSKLIQAINNQLKVLNRLKKRFQRKTISIQIFGNAGNGKSRFIQTISGLDDNTVLTSEADHTTGATTYIQNASSFKAHIYSYTERELLDIFNKNLAQVLIDCGKPNFSISSVSEIGSFDYHAHLIDDDAHYAITGPIRIFTNNYDDIINTITNIQTNGIVDDETGRKYIELTNPEQVQQYVAHHNGKKSTDPGYEEYSRFLAVKYVRLFNPFQCGEAAKIELMDTVGLGNAETNAQVLENMYDAIEENSDMVVQIYCPSSDATWRTFFDSSAQCMQKIHYKDYAHGVERIPNNALFFVINKKKTSTSDNTSNVEQAKNRWTSFRYTETVLVASCADVNETRENVVIPILTRMTQCLKDIDDIKAADANQKGQELYTMYRNFLNQVNEVLLVSSKSNIQLSLNSLFEDLFDDTIHGKMLKIKNDARESMTRPSGLLKRDLKLLCNSEAADELIEDITPILENGIRLHHKYYRMYDDAAAFLRLNIPNRFRSIDMDLQKQIAEKKALIFDCLYSEGRMSTILSHSGDDNKTKIELINEWAKRFTSEVLNDKTYPYLTRLFKNLLDFNINVEGFLLYRIVKHLDVYETNPIERIKEGREFEGVRHHLKINTRDILSKIGIELDNFTQAPNEAIYFALTEFFYSLIFDTHCRKEMQQLYFTYQRSVWEKEMEGQAQEETAFQEWQTVRDNIRRFDKSAKF